VGLTDEVRKGRPPIEPKLEELIVKMARENSGWGYDRIVGALANLSAITSRIRLLVEIGSRQILHHNATAHPTAEWTLQQFREALPGGHPYRFVIHDRDCIFSESVDQGLANLGYGFCEPRCEPQRRTPYANDWAAAFVANVWTS
jgi:hypothetical protein